MAKSSVKFEVTEDVSEGLDALQQRVSDEMEWILNEISYEFTGKEGDGSAPIARRIGRYNHWLYESGQTESARTFDISKDKAEIIINYSGMRYEEAYTDEEFKAWWEFAEDFNPNPYTNVLERDYAYYQETGIDEVAQSHKARNKWAITMGLLGDAYKVPREAARLLSIIFDRH